MSEKRKKIVLSIEEKLKIIDRLKKGESIAKIVKDYGIGESTVRDIKKSENKLIEFVSNFDIDGPSKRKVVKNSKFSSIDGKEIISSVEDKLETTEHSIKSETSTDFEDNGIGETSVRGTNFKSDEQVDYGSNFDIGKYNGRECMESPSFPLINELLTINIGEKRKKIVLSIEDKLKIIDRLKKGESCAKIAKEYGIGESTVRDIKKSEPKLIEYVSSCDIGGPSKRKTMKSSSFPSIDAALSNWFYQMRAKGIPVTGPMCMEKAKEFHQLLNIGGKFNSSNGWFSRFKKRHGISKLANVDKASVPLKNDDISFCETFKEFIEQHDLTKDQIYNADETELFWKRLPSKTSALKNLSNASDYEFYQERISIICCCNASGSHKLKLVVGEANKPHCFKLTDEHSLPVNYYSPRSPWMDSNIFLEWFQIHFVQEVRYHLEKSGKPPKAVLLLGNAPSHPNGELIQSQDGLIRAYYLPPNVRSLIQPLEQGIFTSLKFHYRLNLLNTLIKEDNLFVFWKNISISDAVHEVDRAWSSVNPVIIQRSWNKILGSCFMGTKPTELNVDLGGTKELYRQNEKIIAIILRHKHFQGVKKKNLVNWLNYDTEEEYSTENNEEIFQKVGKNEDSELHNTEDNKEIKVDLSHSKSLECADYLIEYMKNNNFDYHELIFIKKIRSKIRDNVISSKTDTGMTNFFELA